MSVDYGGGSTEHGQKAEALRDGGQQVLTYLYETYATRLFDYCESVLEDPAAATDVVQDSLVTVNAQIGKLPDPDKLRVRLYSIAHQQCASKLAGHRPGPFRRPEPVTLDEFIAEQVGTAFVDDAATEQELGEVAAEAIGRLDDLDGEVLILRFRHGFKASDLAVVLGVSPRRARAMLSAAGTRFQKSAAVVTVIRAGRSGCADLAALAGKRDPVPPPLTRDRRRRLTEHIEACPRCAGRRRAGRVLGPELLASLPLATPPLTLKLRITRTAQALGSYRNPPGPGRPGRPRTRRGLPQVMMISTLGLVMLALPAALLYRFVSTPHDHRRPITAQVTSGVSQVTASTRNTVSAGSSRISPELAPLALGPPDLRRGRGHRLARVPGYFVPEPLALLPLAPSASSPQAIPATAAPRGRGRRHRHRRSLNSASPPA